MELDKAKRPDLDPFKIAAEGAYVLCEKLYVVGMPLQFGDRLPDYVDLHHLHTHYYNGVVGTNEELKSLLGPIELAKGLDSPEMPVALFVTNPSEKEAPLQEQEDRGVFAMENAKLLKTKDDLIAYAEQFDIELKKATNIPIKKMLEQLEKEATEKGLLK